MRQQLVSVCLCAVQYATVPRCNAPQDSVVNKISQIGEIEHAIPFPGGSNTVPHCRAGPLREIRDPRQPCIKHSGDKKGMGRDGGYEDRSATGHIQAQPRKGLKARGTRLEVRGSRLEGLARVSRWSLRLGVLLFVPVFW